MFGEGPDLSDLEHGYSVWRYLSLFDEGVEVFVFA